MEESMSADFKLSAEQAQGKPNITVLRMGGWLDGNSEKQFIDAVQKAKDEGAEYVLIDMREVDTITSTGIRALQKAYQIMTPKGEAFKVPRLKLCNAPAQVYQVLGITGFLANVPMYESEMDAIDSFGK
jgi:anti-anti-sigma factor